MEAADEGVLEIVKLLVDKGANVNATTKSGITALDIANESTNKSVQAYLRERSKK